MTRLWLPPAAAILLLGALSPIAPLGAQERFSEQVAVTEVVVPVRVLVKGRPVAGLSREDFELYDRGERREILGFEVRHATVPLGPSTLAPAAGPMAGRSQGRSLLLLVDFAYTRQFQLARALGELRESLAGRLAPGDRVAVATYGEISGLNLLTGFTADRERLELALDAAAAMVGAGGRRQSEALAALHDARFGGEASTFEVLRSELGPTAALAVLGGPVVYDESEDEGVTVEHQKSIFGPIRVRVGVDLREPVHVALEGARGAGGVRAFGLSLSELAYLLREQASPKEMILLSEGFGPDLLRDARALFYLQKALRACRDSGWTVHAIDARGLAGLDGANFAADSLLFLAQGTGGELIESTNDFGRAMGRLLERTAIVYVLTFQPTDEAAEGEYRKLRVELARRIRGARIDHREGYSRPRPPARREIFERRVDGAEWLLTQLEASELEVAVFAETVVDPTLGGVRAPLVVEVDGDSLLATGSRKTSRVELQVAAFEGEAVRTLLSGEVVVDPSRDREALRRAGVRFSGELGLPRGEYRLRVLVRSHRTGEVFLRSYPLRIGEADGKATLPPPPERPAESWIAVEAERRAAYFR